MPRPDQSIAKLLVLHCAPLIAGMKVSHLLTTDRETYRKITRLLCGTGLSVRPLYRSGSRITYLVYDETALAQHVLSSMHAAFLRRRGYENLSLNGIFGEVTRRYTCYMNHRGAFPHELGILLGYPLQDVIGFMEHEGRNCLFSGYWKVYSLPAQKARLFQSYDDARNTMVKRLEQGDGIRDFLTERALKKAGRSLSIA